MDHFEIGANRSGVNEELECVSEVEFDVCQRFSCVADGEIALKEYAQASGFSVNSKTKKSREGALVYARVVCTRNGRASKHGCGCRFALVIAPAEVGGSFTFRSVTLVHNHSLLSVCSAESLVRSQLLLSPVAVASIKSLSKLTPRVLQTYLMEQHCAHLST